MEVKIGETIVFMETSDSGREGVVSAGFKDKIVARLTQIEDSVRPVCDAFLKTIEGLEKRPSSASAEFGVSLSGEGNFFVTKISGEGSIKLTLAWDLK